MGTHSGLEVDMIQLRSEQEEGERLPNGWAISHRDFLRQVSIAYPIGIHFLVRWGRNIFFWLMKAGYPSWRQKQEHKLYIAGMLAERKYHEGLEERAYKAGQEEAAIQNVTDVIKKMREEDVDGP